VKLKMDRVKARREKEDLAHHHTELAKKEKEDKKKVDQKYHR